VLLRWQINPTDVPAGSVVVGASIALDVTNESGGPYEISRVLRDWDESQATWNEFRTGQPWATAGAAGAADRGAVLATIGSAPVGRQTIALNAAGVDLVRQWLSGAASNFGVIIANASTTNGMDVSSREVAAAANRPMLSIGYVPTPTPGIAGDVNVSGIVDDADIDFLYEAIAVGSADPLFDLNGDAAVDRGDVDHLVQSILGTQYGDANLDTLVNRADAVVLSRNFGKAAAWRTGDFDGDRMATLADLALLQIGMSASGSPIGESPAAEAAAVRIAVRSAQPMHPAEIDAPALATHAQRLRRPVRVGVASVEASPLAALRRSEPADASPTAASQIGDDAIDRPRRIRRDASRAVSSAAADELFAAGIDR
jgi:hypothetical protein